MTTPSSNRRGGFLAAHPKIAWSLGGLLSVTLAGYLAFRVATVEGRAMVFVEQGDAARELEEWAEAAHFYTKAIDVTDDLPYPFHARAVAHAMLGRPDDARNDLAAAKALDASSADFHYHSGIVHEQAEDLPAALRSIDAALGLELRDAYTIVRHRIQARVALRNNDAKTAMRAYAAWSELDPTDPTPHTNMGWAQAMLLDFDGAIASLTRAIELDPEDPTHYSNRAESYLKLQREQDALRDYEKVVELQPNLRNIRKLAICYENVHEWQNAGHAYTKYLESSPRDLEVLGRRGLVRAFAGDQPGSMHDFDRLIEEDKRHALYVYWRGLAKLAGGDRLGAREDQERSAELDMLGTVRQREELEGEVWRLSNRLERMEFVQKYLIGNY